ALVEQLDLFQLLERLAQRRLGVVELSSELVGRTFEILTALYRRLGIGRIGEMRRIMNAGALLLDPNFAFKLRRDALEFGNHAFNLRHPATFFVDLEFLQADERFT